MRTMYDSTDADAIPRDAQMVAGYVDGRYAWSGEDWARFAEHTVRVRISAVGATHLAEVFDVEVGCIWPPANVVPLVQRARAETGGSSADFVLLVAQPPRAIRGLEQPVGIWTRENIVP